MADPKAADISSKPEPVTDLVQQEVASKKEVSTSNLRLSVSSSGGATSGRKFRNSEQQPAVEHSAYYPQSSNYGYFYHGSDNAYTGWGDQGYFVQGDGSETTQYSNIQSDNNGYVYYVPGYSPYSPANPMGVEGQYDGQQQYFTSSGYLQPTVSYGSESLPLNYWDATHMPSEVHRDSRPSVSALNPAASLKPKSLNSVNPNGSVNPGVSALPFDSKGRITASPKVTDQPIRSLNKAPQLRPVIRSVDYPKVNDSIGNISSFSHQGQGGIFQRNSLTTNGQAWVNNQQTRMRDRFNKSGIFESTCDLVRGPRARKDKFPQHSTAEKERLGPLIRRDQYNLPDFQTKYEQARFFMIKSYSEDDIHKSIKYKVWTSTPHGNKKLDDAFRDAQMQSIEKGIKFPIFLFFSVNASGQFVGMAEMIGRVDYDKDMDFWQQNKWNGFFPVKWHIVKDIPNIRFQQIILENNQNRPVTYSRDTQEINLPQGLKMLDIFKGYLAETSILDDFGFYEDLERTVHEKKKSDSELPPPELDIDRMVDPPRNLEPTPRREIKEANKTYGDPNISLPAALTLNPKMSLVALTEKLSLNPNLPKKNTPGE
ncbi:hypothetical protein QJS10_CPA08g01245 [Acorus calamus]|uniref:YTH domain-containing family protein n=1 Tax=Acorus calamus TaxID=4465 RepID=A0AAV9EBC8_ACOCL|nr:hypothetical protein QJS10_CPA08g01245 [Acorus calamus]